MQTARLASALLTAALILGCSGPDSDARAQPGAPADETAQLEGMPYEKARVLIIGYGWVPFPQGCVGGGTTADACRAFPEIKDCSGTGAGFCSMTFAKPRECLHVVTRGGPPRPGSDGETVVDGVRFERTACQREDDAMSPAVPASPGFASFSAPICARLRREGPARTVLVDEFIPGFPAELQDAAGVEAQSLTSTDLDELVRGLACGAALSGYGPDVAEAAVALFASKRHGAAAMAALRRLGAQSTGVEASAARQFADQMRGYLRTAATGNG